MIRLSAAAEPEIFATTHTFGTILENVVVDENGVLDLDDDSKTENTRAAYKLEQIAHALPAKRAGHPSTVIFLTADAFGILPPIARLTREQALYYFLSGLHREARRHRDRCHGAAADVLDVLRPAVPAAAAARLREPARLEARPARLDRGWSTPAGPAGRSAGNRMPIQATRTMLRAALSGELDDTELRIDVNFGFGVPVAVAGVDAKLLDPRSTWGDPEAYDRKARELAKLFAENFARRFADIGEAIRTAGPTL